MLFDYQTLQFVAAWLITIVFVLYVVTAGADFGVTLIVPFLKHKKALLQVIAPTWLANQSWLVIGVMMIFVMWPPVYATLFSFFYGAMFWIVAAFFLRPVGFEYRDKIAHPLWQQACDSALLMSAAVPVFVGGVLLGNLLLGLPIRVDPVTVRMIDVGSFWHLFNGFTLCVGLSGLLLCASHGLALLSHRLTDPVKDHCRRWHTMVTITFLIFFAGLLFWLSVLPGDILVSAGNPEIPDANVVNVTTGAWLEGTLHNPWRAIVLVVTFLGMFASLLLIKMDKGRWGFYGSCVGVIGSCLSVAFCLFPFVVPSSVNPNQSLTIWNATGSALSLLIMVWVSVICLVVIGIYRTAIGGFIWRKKGVNASWDI